MALRHETTSFLPLYQSTNGIMPTEYLKSYEVHHRALSSQPGDFNLIIGHGIRVPLESPDVVKPHFPRGTVHESHVDTLAVPVEAYACSVVAPLTKVDRILRLPPILSGRRRIAVRPGVAVFGSVVSAYRIGAVPGAIRNHRNLRCVSRL